MSSKDLVNAALKRGSTVRRSDYSVSETVSLRNGQLPSGPDFVGVGEAVGLGNVHVLVGVAIDNVYASGPTATPHIYDGSSGGEKLLVNGTDLARNAGLCNPTAPACVVRGSVGANGNFCERRGHYENDASRDADTGNCVSPLHPCSRFGLGEERAIPRDRPGVRLVPRGSAPLLGANRFGRTCGSQTNVVKSTIRIDTARMMRWALAPDAVPPSRRQLF